MSYFSIFISALLVSYTTSLFCHCSILLSCLPFHPSHLSSPPFSFILCFLTSFLDFLLNYHLFSLSYLISHLPPVIPFSLYTTRMHSHAHSLTQTALSAEKSVTRLLSENRSTWLAHYTYEKLVESVTSSLVAEVASDALRDGREAKETAERVSGDTHD